MSVFRLGCIVLLAGCAATVQIAIVPWGELVLALAGVLLFLYSFPTSFTFALAGGFFLDLVGGSFGLRLVIFPLFVIAGRALTSSVLTDRSLLSACILSVVGYLTVSAALLSASVVRAIITGSVLAPVISLTLIKEIIIGVFVQLVVVIISYGVMSLVTRGRK